MTMATAKKTTKTTAVTKAKASLPMPADAAERMRADIEAMKAKLAAPGGDGIQITQSKEFKLPDGSKVDSFKGIIVDFVSFNAYYEGAYNPDNVVPPNCFAIGTVKNDDLVPSDSSPERQDDDCGSCKGCWAKFYCSGGCHANAYNFNGTVMKPYSQGCEMQKKRIECAIMVEAALKLEELEQMDNEN